jgi:hypothetical protein
MPLMKNEVTNYFIGIVLSDIKCADFVNETVPKAFINLIHKNDRRKSVLPCAPAQVT